MARTSVRRCIVACIAVVALVGASGGTSAAAPTAVVSGVVYEDADRDGAPDADEPRRPGMLVNAFSSATGDLVGSAVTDDSGSYSFSGLPEADYSIRLDAAAWQPLRADWVPTTTGSLYPRHAVSLSGSVTADFGLRPIVRSTDLSAPLSSYTGPSGVVVRSYVDVVPALTVHEALERSALSGGERATTVVSFGYPTATSCTVSVAGAPGTYSGFSARIWVDYLSWLDSGDMVLTHEYGHAWAQYHDYVVQQDGLLTSYLAARGLTGDSRLGTDKHWDPGELIAEDFRQLFGSPAAASYPQANSSLPPAAAVPGLSDFLATTFMTAPAGEPTGDVAPVAPVAPLTVSVPAVTPAPVVKAATVSTVLNAPAVVTIVLRKPSGDRVRTLLHEAARPAGEVSALWDRRDDAGRRVRSGTYSVQVTAVDSEGRTARAETNVDVQ